MPTVRHVWQLIPHVDHAFSIDLKDAFCIFLLLSFIVSFYDLFGEICCVSGKFYLLDWPQSVCMSVSLPPDELADIQQFVCSPFCRLQPVIVCQVMSFLGKAKFCTSGHWQLQQLCHVIQSDMLTVCHSPAQLFFFCTISFSALVSTRAVIPFAIEPSSFAVSVWQCSYYWRCHDQSLSFLFSGSGLPLQVSGSWTGFICRAHMAFQELQAVAMMLHRMAFHLSSKVVALHLHISTAKAYLCNQCGAVCPFLSRLAWHILSVTDKQSITFVQSYIPTHLKVEASYLRGQLLPEWHLPHIAQAAFELWGLPEVDLLALSCTTYYQLYYPLETPLPMGALVFLICIQPSLDVSGRLCLSSCIRFSSSDQVSGRTCERPGYWFCWHHGGSLASQSS